MKTNGLILLVSFLLITGMVFGQTTVWKFDKAHTKLQFYIIKRFYS